MPNVADYDNEDEWMSACVPTRIDEGDEQDQAVAVCLSIWREREGKAMDAKRRQSLGARLMGGLSDGVRPARPLGERENKTMDNALKTIKATDDELRVGNYIVLYGTRDLEGYGSPRVNGDGSRGEYFAPDTVLESAYTKAGTLFVDWEHLQDVNPKTKQPVTETFGVVDWKTAQADERGMWVERILDRRNRYVRWVESLIAAGLIGTSSEAVSEDVEKAADGKITRWPLRRDTLTVQPMEFRNMKEFGENQIQALKALGISVPDDTTADEPEPEAEPEADTSAADAVKARLLRLRLSQLEEQ